MAKQHVIARARRCDVACHDPVSESQRVYRRRIAGLGLLDGVMAIAQLETINVSRDAAGDGVIPGSSIKYIVRTCIVGSNDVVASATQKRVRG